MYAQVLVPGRLLLGRQHSTVDSKEMVRGRVDELDDAILSLYDEGRSDSPLVLPPRVVWYNLVKERAEFDISADAITKRLKTLTSLGLLEQPDQPGGYYRLTPKGQKYLAGEIEIVPTERADSPDTGPLSDLAWKLLEDINAATIDEGRGYTTQEPVQRALGRLLQYGLVTERGDTYEVTPRGITALELQDVYREYGHEEFFYRLTQSESEDA